MILVGIKNHLIEIPAVGLLLLAVTRGPSCEPCDGTITLLRSCLLMMSSEQPPLKTHLRHRTTNSEFHVSSPERLSQLRPHH